MTEAGRSVGVVGLGNMGLAIVGRLVQQGFEVAVWNRSPGPVAEAVALGAVAAADPAAVLKSGVVLSVLSADAAVREIFTAELLASGPPGLVHVNMATVGVAAAVEFAALHTAAGVGYLAAPVLGRPPVAAAGKLNVVVGGPETLLDRVRPVLAELSTRIWHLGEAPEVATTAKIGVNYLLVHALQALSEAVTIAERSGIDPGGFVELVAGTLFPGPVYAGYGAMMAETRYEPPLFSTALGRKDLGLAVDAADRVGAALPSATMLMDVFDAALAMGNAELDWASIVQVTRARSSDTSDTATSPISTNPGAQR